jgi:hypothetical protein
MPTQVTSVESESYEGKVRFRIEIVRGGYYREVPDPRDVPEDIRLALSYWLALVDQ